jgi:hypothetical protein
LRFVLTTAMLFVSVWVIGFHVAIPIYVFAYLMVYGGVRWWVALLCAAFFEAFMVVAYDIVIRQAWPEPLIRLPFVPHR